MRLILDMHTRWTELWPKLPEKPVFTAFTRLVQRYTEPHRAYHDLRHIREMLFLYVNARQYARLPEAVELAIWYHDVIYDPESKDNEINSGLFAMLELSDLGVSRETRECVDALILATKHTGSVGTRDEQIIVDLDLATLGAQPDIYDFYSRSIRKEYEFVPLKEYRAGRAKILQGFLDRTNIYGLPHFRDKFEKQARENIAREIASLIA